MAEATTTTDTDKGAADVAASGASGTEADKAIADKAQADKAAADQKAATDKIVADAVATVELKYKAPDKYEGLKLPDKITVDPALVERTAATARTLGLSQEKAQGFVDFVAQEAARETAAALSAYTPPTKENPDGGAKWKEQNEAWRAASLADKELGDGKPDQLKAASDLATKVLARFGDPESIEFVDSLLGSNPAALRILVRIGKAMGEKALVKPSGDSTPGGKSDVEVFYPKGAGRTSEEINRETVSA